MVEKIYEISPPCSVMVEITGGGRGCLLRDSLGFAGKTSYLNKHFNLAGSILGVLNMTHVDTLPVVILDLHVMPFAIGDTTDNVDVNLGSLSAPGRKHKFYSFILNGERDKIMFAIVSSIVQ